MTRGPTSSTPNEIDLLTIGIPTEDDRHPIGRWRPHRTPMSPQRTVHEMSTTARVMSIDELQAAVGQDLGTTSWLEVSQEDVNRFADATGDHQWIHTDPERAATSPFGGTIAHGYYTLSLAPVLLARLLSLEHFPMAVNYGLDRLRFPAPLTVGAKLRMTAAVDGVDRFDGGATLRLTLNFESDRGGKPVCIAQVLYRLFERAV